MSPHRSPNLLLACLCVALTSAAPAAALPPGRAWAPVGELLEEYYPSVVFFSAARMEVDSEGRPILIIETRWSGAPHSTWNLFAWQDDRWVHKVDGDLAGNSVPEIVLSLTPARHMVWLSKEDPSGFARMVMAEFTDEGFGEPDTAMVTLSQSSQRSGAAAGRRRWVVRSQSRFPTSVKFAIRTVYSDTAHIWHELPELGVDEDHCTMAPLSDTSAIVVYSGESGLGWAVVEGDRWTQQGILDPRPLRSGHPRFRFRPSGGLWLMWSDRRWVHMSRYVDGQWSWGDSLQAVHPPGQTFIPAWNDLTQDEAERPILAWVDLGFGTTFRDVGSIAFPTEDGWSPGEEIPGSDLIFASPFIAKDRNGDVWVAWRVRGGIINRWTHTYVSATTSTPVVLGAGRDRLVTWSLSEPAPESWWAVLRARNDGPFEQVVRVEAGATTEMSWTDSTPPAGVLRYRIRRESEDARDRWESEVAHWPPKSARPFSLARSSTAVADGRLELEGADAGRVEVRVYDLQGRLVLEQESQAGGTGRDTVNLDIAGRVRSLPNGIYFATARDAHGRVTHPLKLVILR